MGPNEILDKSILVTSATPLFHVVAQTGVEEGGVITAASAAWLGVAQEGADTLDVANGRHVRVRVEGISACVAGAAIAEGDFVAAAADGRVVPAPAPAAPAAGTTTTVHIVGIARTGGVAGDHVSVQLTPGNRAQRFG